MRITLDPQAIARRTRPNAIRAGAFTVALVGGVSCALEDAPESWTGQGALVIENATVFTSPRTEPILNGAVLIVDGVIEAVGGVGDFLVPASAVRVDGTGLSVLPGFWNTHARLDEELLEAARTAAAPELEEMIRERFTRFGFTSIVETATPLENLSVLVDRIQSGEVMGPRIVSAEGGGSAGVWLPSAASPIWPIEFAPALVAEGIAVVPGLGFVRERPEAGVTLDEVLTRLRGFVDIGGRFLFGTGAGYVSAYDPLADHFLLEDIGIPFALRFASLTTEPSVRFGYDYVGEIVPGMVADLVLVEGDPEVDVTAFGRVRLVLREARTLFW